MKKYKIAIEETVTEEFEVEADNLHKAMEIAAKKYYDGEFVAAPGEAQAKKMAVIEPDCENSAWTEF